MDFECPILDVQFHPQLDLLGVAGVDGRLHILEYDSQMDQITPRTSRVIEVNSAIRSIAFNCGNYVALGSSEGTVKVFEIRSGCDRFQQQDCEQVSERVVKVAWLSEEVIVSGSENGIIRVYDKRLANPVIAILEDCDDEIFDLASTTNRYHLLATSGDQLAVFDLRGKSKLLAMSDRFDDDFVCMQLCLNDTRVICGTNSGPLGVFHYGDFGDIKSRIQGLSTSSNCIEALDDDTLLVGSENGNINVISVTESLFCGVLCTQANTAAHNNSIMEEESEGEMSTDDESSSSDTDDGAYPVGTMSVDSISVDKDCRVVITASVTDGTVQLFPVKRAWEMKEAALRDHKDIDMSETQLNNFFEDL